MMCFNSIMMKQYKTKDKILVAVVPPTRRIRSAELCLRSTTRSEDIMCNYCMYHDVSTEGKIAHLLCCRRP